MASNKSRPEPGRSALEPRRAPGRKRVAALLEAASAVIAERGYEAATMAEIAARAGALVGSLYHFFPNKEALADALIRRYEGIVADAFAAIDARAPTLPVEALSDALLDLMLEIRGESQAVVALLDARADGSAKRADFLIATTAHIARTLMLRSSRLSREQAEAMAVVLLHNMKAMKALVADPGATQELRDMTRLYLLSKLRDEG